MSIRTVRWLVSAYMLLFTLAIIWPGATLYNRAEPIVLGLPFNMFVLAALITFALGMLIVLYISETRSRD